MVRLSPGSPSQWIATCSPCPASTCRSTQLTATLSLPPTNHFANGASHSRTLSHFWAQVSRSACSAQKASRSSSPREYQSSVALACAANSALGGKLRVSLERLERVGPESAMVGVSSSSSWRQYAALRLGSDASPQGRTAHRQSGQEGEVPIWRG